MLLVCGCEPEKLERKTVLNMVRYEYSGYTRFKLIAGDGTVLMCEPEDYVRIHEGDQVTGRWINSGSIQAQ